MKNERDAFDCAARTWPQSRLQPHNVRRIMRRHEMYRDQGGTSDLAPDACGRKAPAVSKPAMPRWSYRRIANRKSDPDEWRSSCVRATTTAPAIDVRRRSVSSAPAPAVEKKENDRYIRTDIDLDWSLHRRFYQDVGKHLAPDGVILMQEYSGGSKPEDFKEMIESAGLRTVRSIPSRGHAKFYYLWVERA